MQTLIYWCSSGYSDALLKPIHFQIHNPLSIIILFLFLVPVIFLQVLWVIIVISVNFLSLKVH